MANARIRNQPEDYLALGVNPGPVEVWEDGLRDDFRPGSYEWWYFDAIMTDGTKVVLDFKTKEYPNMHDSVSHPAINMKITPPNAETIAEHEEYKPEEARFGKEKCDVSIAEHRFEGDLKTYKVKVAPINGLGCDLQLSSLSTPYRLGSGYFSFDDEDKEYFTWLCSVPRGKVSGTVTVNGETRAVEGYGYHDHQWGNVNPLFVWNHWLWGRTNLGDYTLIIFDYTADKKYGHKRIPIFCIQDNHGNIVFENKEGVKFEVLEEFVDEETQKIYPKISKYTFENDGKTVEFTLSVRSQIHSYNMYGEVPEEAKQRFDALGKQPTYIRFSATAKVVITGDGETIERSTDDMIYEFAYMGQTYKVHEELV